MEAEDFKVAEGLLLNADPILDRWGFGRYLEMQYNRLLSCLNIDEVAATLHNLGILHQNRGEHEEALKKYQDSLEISEELGNRAGVAITLGQIGKLYIELKGFQKAFELSLSALSTFIELQSPNAKIVASNLKVLRSEWGEANFDAAWQVATGGYVPDWLKE